MPRAGTRRSALYPVPMALVEYRGEGDVYKSFATNSGTWVPMRERIRQIRNQGARITVSDITFDVHRGELFGIVGATAPARAPC